MAKGIKVIVGDLTFDSKKSAKDFYRTIRDKYGEGERLNEEDQGLVTDLIALHPEAKDKIGAGIVFFTVHTDFEFGTTRHFMVHRKDGSHSDFSFPHCIDGKRDSRREVLEALRRAVKYQIVAFRDSFFRTHQGPVHCPLRGISITSDSYHVDHDLPGKFSVLVEQWLAASGLSLSEIKITPPADNQVVAEMICPDQRNSWTRFHQRHAKLRMLSPIANLSDARKRPKARSLEEPSLFRF